MVVVMKLKSKQLHFDFHSLSEDERERQGPFWMWTKGIGSCNSVFHDFCHKCSTDLVT